MRSNRNPRSATNFSTAVRILYFKRLRTAFYAGFVQTVVVAMLDIACHRLFNTLSAGFQGVWASYLLYYRPIPFGTIRWVAFRSLRRANAYFWGFGFLVRKVCKYNNLISSGLSYVI